MRSVTDSAPTSTLVQLTDLHIVAEDEELPHGVDTAALLDLALRAVEDAAICPAALVLTGDLTVRVGDLRILVLDSTVPGHPYGALRPGQLDRLRAELAEPVPAGTVLALHHPPLPSAAPLASAIRLLRRDDLAAAIAGTDVRLVLAGHTHVVSAGALGGGAVWTGGPLATTLDGLAPGAAL